MQEFKAPEQLRSERQTIEVDMYSLGCVFFYGITQGSHPFGEADVCAEIINKKNPSNLSMLDHFPEAKHLILGLLEDEPKKRCCHFLKLVSITLHIYYFCLKIDE